jgi:hypothetical protein
MNKVRNKYIFIVAILVIIFTIIIFNNKDDISKMIGINVKEVTENNSYYYLSITCKKKINNPYILAAYKYNDSVSSGTAGYCVDGTENTCEYNDCYFESHVGQCAAGTIIKYQVNDNDIYYFNVLHDDGGVMTLQSVDAFANSFWGTSISIGPVTALTSITEKTKDWSNVNDLTYSLGETFFLKYPNYSWNNNSYTSCDSYNSCTYNSYTLKSDLTTNVKARIISVQEATDLGCRDNSPGCPTFFNLERQWTLNTANEKNIWDIYKGTLRNNYYSELKYENQIKAVIEINK